MTGHIGEASGRHVGGCCDAHGAGQGTAITNGDGKGLEAVGDIEMLVRLLQEVQGGEAGNKQWKSTLYHAMSAATGIVQNNWTADGRREGSEPHRTGNCHIDTNDGEDGDVAIDDVPIDAVDGDVVTWPSMRSRTSAT